MDSNLISSVDGQHDPADIPKFLQALKSGADHAAGNRLPHTKMPTIRRLGYKALALLHRILIAKLNDPFNGYRALSRKALKTLDQDFDPAYGVETEINYQLRKTKNAEIPTTAKQGKLPTPRTQPSLMSLRQEICNRVIATWDTAIYYASYMSPSFYISS
jgi:hypothetical protein